MDRRGLSLVQPNRSPSNANLELALLCRVNHPGGCLPYDLSADAHLPQVRVQAHSLHNALDWDSSHCAQLIQPGILSVVSNHDQRRSQNHVVPNNL